MSHRLAAPLALVLLGLAPPSTATPPSAATPPPGALPLAVTDASTQSFSLFTPTSSGWLTIQGGIVDGTLHARVRVEGDPIGFDVRLRPVPGGALVENDYGPFGALSYEIGADGATTVVSSTLALGGIEVAKPFAALVEAFGNLASGAYAEALLAPGSEFARLAPLYAHALGGIDEGSPIETFPPTLGGDPRDCQLEATLFWALCIDSCGLDVFCMWDCFGAAGDVFGDCLGG